MLPYGMHKTKGGLCCCPGCGGGQKILPRKQMKMSSIAEGLSEYEEEKDISKINYIDTNQIKRVTMYGENCPTCGKPGISRERTPNGKAFCVDEHSWQSGHGIPDSKCTDPECHCQKIVTKGKYTSKINYITGNALEPKVDGDKAIVHVCNNAGGWGAGFVVAISKKWKDPEEAYRDWYRRGDITSYDTFRLGMVQPVPVESDIVIFNMIAQHNTISIEPGSVPIRYDALRECLIKVVKYMKKKENPSTHMPRIGCGLAGGRWSEIEKIVEKELKDIPTYVYTLENDNSWR